jgi:glycosyltransferase involved in cell wall biosynthesis
MSVMHIPYSVETDTCCVLPDRTVVRRALGLEEEVYWVLTVADDTSDPRKGIPLLEEALKGMRTARNRPVKALAVGGGRTETSGNVLRIARVSDSRLLSLYYNAADVLVLPTLADNLPNVLIEGIATGTPCVAFDTGGCRDVVRDGVTGFLARPESVENLRECVLRILNAERGDAENLRASCRRVAETEYSLDRQGAAYLELFNKVALSHRRPKAGRV